MTALRSNQVARVTVCLLIMSLLVVGVSIVPTSLAAGPPAPDSIPPGVDPWPEPNEQPLPSRVKTGSDAAFNKLSPDLRELAKIRPKQPVLISILMTKDAPPETVAGLMIRAAIGKPMGELRWVAGEVDPANLLKLAGIPGVISVISTETYQPMDAPGEEELKPQRGRPSRAALHSLLRKEGKQLLLRKQEKQPSQRVLQRKPSLSPTLDGDLTLTSVKSVKVRDIHGASAAHAKGYTGTGVVAAVVDTGVDFGHPDLQGTQARIAGGPYDGWPYAYNTLSGLYYALGSITIGPDNYWDWVTWTWYAHTLPVTDAICNTITCTAMLKIDYGTDAGWPWPPVELPFTWPDTSKSGTYYYTVHPDFSLLNAAFNLGLGYGATDQAPPAVIVSDQTTPGVYDTVYTDVDFDQDLTDEKPMRKGDELAGVDLFDAAGDSGTDGIWDLSAGILTWIADGTNHPPGVDAVYILPPDLPVPGAGQLLSFVGDEDSHGTNVAGMIAAQGVITDPRWIGPINPLFAGAANIGGVGGPVLAGMAPDAKVAAFQNGFSLPFDSWWLSALGFDGVPNTGDESQVVNNSWGSSSTINDGWDATSRFAHWLNRNFAPYTAFLVATGNGGHGYGTAASPNGATIIGVGASTSYGTTMLFEFVDPSQFTWGDVQPWSNRGPTMLGDVEPEVVCVGAWGTGANPLNIWTPFVFTGQAAYDLFGGTSMASPVCTGVLALVYQAFKDAHGRWPTWEEATDILINGATDLGYDVLSQGSGNANADRSTDIAAGNAISVTLTSAQWQAGDYRGTRYPAFPAVMHPGDTATATFTAHNPATTTADVNLSDTTLKRVHELVFNITFPAGAPPEFQIPTWITDVTSLIDTYDPDLVRAQVIFPFEVFDPGDDYNYDNRWRVLFYDWMDLDGDGQLWTDTNQNGVIDATLDGNSTNDEIDAETGPFGESEYNRFTYGYPSGTYLEASVGRNSLSRRHDGVFLGLQRRTGTDPVTLQVRLTFYKKADWSWLTLSTNSVNVPPSGSAVFTATLSVPADARPGVYQGAIEYSAGSTQVLPVVVHVAANSTTFDFGATSLTEPLGDQPYDNGHLLGGFDWSWRYESGDWKLFYFDIPDGTAGPGKAMIVDTRWLSPTVSLPSIPSPIFFEDFESWPPAGWNIVDNAGTCTWDAGSNDVDPESNETGGAGDYADADSDNCGTGMDTELWTPTLNLSGLSQAWLGFKSDFQDFNSQDDGYVDISTNGGATWTNLLHYEKMDFPGPRTVYIDLTPYVGSADTIIRFRYVAPGWDWWWQVDDVAIYDEDPRLPPVTDVDTWIYGAAPDFYSTDDPDFFGPSNVEQVGGSNDTYIGSGTFIFDTATGGPREVVAGEIRDGLGFLALHNVLYAGAQFGEPVVGNAYQLHTIPFPVVITTTLLTGSWTETFTSTRTIDEGVSVLAFGLSQPTVLTDQPAIQDDPTDPCTASWVQDVDIANGGLLDATTTSADPALDIDLYVYRDDGDGIWECDGEDVLIGSSLTPTADERVRVTLPPDGKYWVTVHGWSVPVGSLFDITINAVQGTDLTPGSVPIGAIPANVPQAFTVDFAKAIVPSQTYQGLLFLGPTAAPTALEVPVTVNFVLADGDGDGIPDYIEGGDDADGDGTPNYLDTDSDGDGISDEREGVTDTDNDGIPNYLDTDSDNDGIPDEREGLGDADGDGTPNYLDTDSDGDGISDKREGVTDTDDDGIPNYLDTDSDNDGIPDGVEGVLDIDGDGIPNYLDTDSDNDGIPDTDECPAGPPCPDSDGDNIPDYLDPLPVIRAVGGYGEPLSALELLAPWLGLVALFVVGIIVVLLRRRPV